MLKILGKTSSINVRKVLWTCREIGVPFAREDWGSGFRPTDDPAFLALNPNGLVPVVEDAEGILWESNTICRYLAASHGRDDLLPAAPRGRALVEQWMDWQAMELNPTWRYAFYALVRLNPDYQDPDQIAASARAWNGKMSILEGQLAKTRAFVTGDVFTLADIVLALSVNRWMMTPIDRPPLPAIAAYYERMSERPGFIEFGRSGIA